MIAEVIFEKKINLEKYFEKNISKILGIIFDFFYIGRGCYFDRILKNLIRFEYY